MITIATYKELSDFVAAFGNGHLSMLVICSAGGFGKSEEARRTLSSQDVVLVGGHVTPLGLYELLFNGRDRPVVFDEIDGLLTNATHVGLLKQLCETRTPKRVQWASSDRRAQQIDSGRGHFFTGSPVLMLCNSFESLNANVAALETRGTVLRFVPPPLEILTKIKSFATDAEIVAFLERYHTCLPHMNLRIYPRLKGLKEAGLDWRRYALAESTVHPKVLAIADLLTRFSNDIQRIKHYTLGCRRDYYNWKPEALAHVQLHLTGTLDENLRDAG